MACLTGRRGSATVPVRWVGEWDESPYLLTPSDSVLTDLPTPPFTADAAVVAVDFPMAAAVVGPAFPAPAPEVDR